MPEFEARRTSIPPFTPPLRRDDEDDRLDLEVGEAAGAPPPREGLPPGYRMRHDAHYVEQLTGRTAVSPHVRTIALRDIDTAPASDLSDLESLVRSIARHGVLQPLLVRPRTGRFELIAGSRRLRAAALAGLSEVPCVVRACDDTGARALAEADNLRRAPQARTTPAPPSASNVPPTALRELRQSFSGIRSCLHLLGERDLPLRDRVALDLIRAEAHRAHRLVQCLTLLAQAPPPLSPGDVQVAKVLDEVLDGFDSERRLSSTVLSVQAESGDHTAVADPEWLRIGLCGAIGAFLAMVQNAKAPTLQIRVATAGSSVIVEIAQHAVSVPEWAVSRFFEPAWTDRPGGYQAAVELAAARHAVERQGGSVDVLAGDRGGCRLALALPRARQGL